MQAHDGTLVLNGEDKATAAYWRPGAQCGRFFYNGLVVAGYEVSVVVDGEPTWKQVALVQ